VARLILNRLLESRATR